MARWFLTTAFAIALLAAPAVIACESCIAPGNLTPAGTGPFTTYTCYTQASGSWSYCWGGTADCGKGDPENTCPEPGTGNCIQMPGGGQVCVYTPEMLRDAPVNRCDAVDVGGRCVANRKPESSFLN